MTDTQVVTHSLSPRLLVRGRYLVVWVALVGATVLSFWLGTDPGLPTDTPRAVLIFVVAFVKVYLVGRYFMELGGAGRPLRRLLAGYCVVVCLTLVGFYLFA